MLRGRSRSGLDWRAALWVSLFTAVAVGALAWLAALDYVETGLASALGMRLTSDTGVGEGVAIVLLDAGSGGLPEDRFLLRGKLGELLEQLYRCDPPPKVIGFDYYFEGDGTSPDEVAATRKLANAIAAAPRDTSVVVGLDRPGEQLTPDVVEKWVAEFEGSIIGRTGRPTWALVRGGSKLGIVDRVLGAARGSPGTNALYPGLAVRLAVGRSTALELKAGSLRAEGYDIPLDRNGYMLVRFRRARAEERYPLLSELLEEQGAQEEAFSGFAGKRVIVASASEGRLPTPAGEMRPAAIYAQAASDILDRNLLRPWPFPCLLIVIALLSGATSLAFGRPWGTRITRSVALLGLAVVPALALALVAHGAWGVITDITYPALSVFLAAFMVSRLTPGRVAALSEGALGRVAEALQKREAEPVTTEEQGATPLEQAKARIAKSLQHLDEAVQDVTAGDRSQAWLLTGMCLVLFTAYAGFLSKAWGSQLAVWKSALDTLAGTAVFGALVQWPFRQVLSLFIGNRELRLAVPVLRVQLEAASSQKKCQELAAEIDERIQCILARCKEGAAQSVPAGKSG